MSEDQASIPTRRQLLAGLAAAGGAVGAAYAGWRWLRPRPPNVVLILTDDQGYNDVGCYYTPPDTQRAYAAIRTPRLDQMADEGLRLTQFYVAASVCTPSRAALMTGCYPPRVGFATKDAGIGVLSPASRVGINPEETTMAEMFRNAGYATACVGKWHLGHHEPFQPLSQGFDEFFGIPWSANQRPLPLVHNRETLRRLPSRPVLVRQFTDAAINFAARHRDDPFFLYLAYSAPHEPWAVLPGYRGRSARGLYGDIIEMMDEHVGQLVDAIDEMGLAEDTLFVFTSDNGPWLDPPKGGSAWPLRGGKADVWEGGYRSPCIWRWPSVLGPGTAIDEVVTALDLLPTFARLAGAPHPVDDDHPIDGHDVWPVLHDNGASPTDVFYYYARGRLEAARRGRFKLVFDNPIRTPPISRALYDLVNDPSETEDVEPRFPDEAAAIERMAENMRRELGDGILGIPGAAIRPLGKL